MKNYVMQFSDGRKTYFQCESKQLSEFTARLIKVYAERGLKVQSMPKEQRS